MRSEAEPALIARARHDRVVGRARPPRIRGAPGERERHAHPRRWAVVAIAVALAVLVVLVGTSLALVGLDLAVAVLFFVAVGRQRP